MTLALSDSQFQAASKIRNGTILKGGVGSGKSRTGLYYYWTVVCGGTVAVNGEGRWSKGPTALDLYIITTPKKRDEKEWEEECVPFGLGAGGSGSDTGDHASSGVKVTVDSWNNVKKYVGVVNAFFIFDEQRAIGSGAWARAFITIAKKNQWIMLSATPGDTWMDYIPVFVANGFYKNRTEFITRHVVFSAYSKFPKVDRYVETGTLEQRRRQVLVEMSVVRHTNRHPVTVPVGYDESTYSDVLKRRWNIFTERPCRNASELLGVLRRVVNQDVSRLGEVLRIAERHRRVIVFYNFNYELEALRTVIGTLGFTCREWNGHVHDSVPEGDDWVYLVQYTAGAEGWNCITADTIIFFSENYSYRVVEQASGRIDRLNTPFTDLQYYFLRSTAPIDMAIKRSRKSKELFSERKYAESLGLPSGDWDLAA